jgi:YbbR domain-containing protein
VRGALGFVFRNWPLKVAAILLATLLYAGLIVSASAETFRGSIPIQVLNQPEETFILGTLDDVTAVRYVSIGGDRPALSSSSFTATIDLANVEAVAGAPPVSVAVTVRAVDPRIQVVDFSPSRVAVRLDPAVTKDVPVRVDLGTVPPGLDVREPVVSQDSVAVSGPDSAVRLVTAAVARVRIDPSGVDVNETVGLLPVDARGEVVEGVNVEPSAVRVTVQIGSQLATQGLPVTPVITGSPASTVEIASVDVQPALVTVEGDADALGGLTSIDTRPISIAGASQDVVTEVGLVVPEGVAILGVDRVRVTITLRPKQGTRSYDAGVEIVGGDPGFVYEPAVDQVRLTVGGSVAALDTIDAARLTARLEVGALREGTTNVPVTVILPEGVTLVSSSPPEVAVTVIPIATPAPAATPTPTPSPSPVPTPSPEP